MNPIIRPCRTYRYSSTPAGKYLFSKQEPALFGKLKSDATYVTRTIRPFGAAGPSFETKYWNGIWHETLYTLSGTIAMWSSGARRRYIAKFAAKTEALSAVRRVLVHLGDEITLIRREVKHFGLRTKHR